MDYDQYVGQRRDRIRARKGRGSGGTGALAVAIGAVLVLAATVLLYALIAAGPLMLVLGALHSSDNMSWVPAWGFWQTLGVLFVVGSFGRAFHPSATTSSSKS